MFWNTVSKKRDIGRESTITLEKEVSNYQYKQQVPSNQSFVISEPININFMEQIIEKFSSLNLAEKEFASQALLKQLVKKPDYGIALETSYFQSHFQNQEIYLSLRAATCFGQGRIEEATNSFEQIVSHYPTPYNFCYLSRCYNASNQLDKAVESMDQALAHYPGDYYLLRGKTLFLYLQHRTREANVILEQIRPMFYEDPEQQPVIEAARRLERELKDAENREQIFRFSEADIYDDSYTRSTWWSYWIEYNYYSPHQFAGTWVSQAIQDRLRDLLLQDQAISNVVDFGVLCAEPNYRVAKQFPQVRFVGLDRQPLVKELNDQAYGHMPNMAFYAGDVGEVLPQIVSPEERSVFFHCRTSCFLYPAHLQQIYQQCAELNVRYIAIYETTALSRLTYTYYDFEDMPMDTVPNKSLLYIHNYGRILAAAGYKIVKEERLSPHTLVSESKESGGAASFILAEKQ